MLSEVAPTALNRLPEHLKARLSVVQQCRPEDLDGVRAAYAESGVRAELSVFFDDIPERMAACHLMIARSALPARRKPWRSADRPSWCAYRCAIDDHQSANAHAVDDCGAGWLMEQKESFDADALTEQLVKLFPLPKTLLLAASNAKRNGRPDAAERLADMVFDLIGADEQEDTDNPDKTNNEEAA